MHAPSRLLRTRRLLPAVCLTALASFGIAAPSAGAATADATLTAGTLAFVGAPANVTFPAVALDGTNKTTSQSQLFNVADARGSGAGWNITATSTAFTNGTYFLSNTATQRLTVPGVACDSGVTCTVATNSITSPWTLPAAQGTAPTPAKMYNAAANTGLGGQDVTTNWTLNVPADARAGAYTSTWTFSLVSGP